jgi:CHASE2 domain-containing sensor protein
MLWPSRPRLFISYRRADARSVAGRLFDWTLAEFGKGRVFLDSASIPFGDDFRRVVAEQLARCDVVLVVIGPGWLGAADERGRRLEQADDPVRYELLEARAAGRRIVPVLVGGALPPREAELPEALRWLAPLNMAPLRDDSFASDFDALIDELIGRQRGQVRTELDHLRRLAVGTGGWLLTLPLLAGAIALAAWVGLADVLQLDTLALRALLSAAPAAEDSGVLLVGIDAASETALGREFTPALAAAWRADHARLIDRAARAGARAVVFDLVFESPGGADEALADAARRAQQRGMPVVFGVREIEGGRPRLIAPLHAAAARWGTVCLVTRGDGLLWLSPLALLRAGATQVLAPASTPSLALAAVVPAPISAVDRQRRTVLFDGPPLATPLRYSSLLRQRLAPTGCSTSAADDEVAALLVRVSPADHWKGAPRAASYAEVLDAARWPDQRLAGRSLLVGVTALARPGGHRDMHVVHSGPGGVGARTVYGVELQADAIATLLSGRVPRLPTVDRQVGMAVFASALGALLSLAVYDRPRGPRRLALAAGVLLWLGLAVVLARHDLLTQPAYDLIALCASYGLVRGLQALARSGRFVRKVMR